MTGFAFVLCLILASQASIIGLGSPNGPSSNYGNSGANSDSFWRNY